MADILSNRRNSISAWIEPALDSEEIPLNNGIKKVHRPAKLLPPKKL
jgi:hypothetical protein